MVQTVSEFIASSNTDRFRLMDLVQAVQQRLGYVSEEAIAAIADKFQVPANEIVDMVSFYTFLNLTPRGRFHIRVTKTPVSYLKGAEKIANAFIEATGIEIGASSPDGLFSLDWTNDIGMSDQEPSALINGTVVTKLVPEDAKKIVRRLQQWNGYGFANGPDGMIDVKGADLPKTNISNSLVKAGSLLFANRVTIKGVQAALKLTPDEIIKQIIKAQLRGRGGAGFPTGVKWQLCRQAPGAKKYVVCNADEGEPGTFKDRVILENAPDLLFEGMTIAGYALGAEEGLVYLRGEYSYMLSDLNKRLAERRKARKLGHDCYGRKGFNFDIYIHLGAGSYVCGEESALLESLEGKRGSPRDRPPFPIQRGYRNNPTAVNNVETFACVVRIMENGPEHFSTFGTSRSTGTKLFSVSGDCEHPGVYELPFGITINELLDMVGAVDASFVQVGGPSGQCVAPKDYGRRLSYEDLPTGGSIMIFGGQRDILKVVSQFTEFFVEESCGWCAPCRVGTTLLHEHIKKICKGKATLEDIKTTAAIAETVSRTSRCGLGQTAPNPIMTTMLNFPEAYEARLNSNSFMPRIELAETLAEAVKLQGKASIGGGIA